VRSWCVQGQFYFYAVCCLRRTYDVHCDSDDAVCGQKLATLSSSDPSDRATTLHLTTSPSRVEQSASAAFVATFVCISCAELSGVMPCSLVDKYQCCAFHVLN
jgi:hypothetical protein